MNWSTASEGILLEEPIRTEGSCPLAIRAKTLVRPIDSVF